MSTPVAPERHRTTAQLGMWSFLSTEILLFGGLLAAYTLCRFNFPRAFAEGARHMELGMGTLNTAFLLISSVFVAVAERAVRAGRRGLALLCLGAAAALGVAFLGVKGSEYHTKVVDGLVPGAGFRAGLGADPALQLFFFLYFALTGLHAAHLILGLAGIGWVAWGIGRRRVGAERPEPMAVIGLYWHFVDCLWVFLYPLFYLPGR